MKIFIAIATIFLITSCVNPYQEKFVPKIENPTDIPGPTHVKSSNEIKVIDSYERKN